MTLPSLDPRLSLAARLRGWTDDATALEQRLKDLETFRRSHRRRWVIAVGLFLIGVVGRFFGAAEVSLTMITAVFSAALIGNALLGIVNERGWYRWWGIYVLAVFDVLLVAVPIVWFGHGGFVAAFFLAILPYTFDQGQAVGDFLVLAGSLAYLGASVLHARWYRDDPNFLTPTVLETVVFVAVAWVLRRIPATLITRIRQARGVIGEAEQGYLAVRAARRALVARPSVLGHDVLAWSLYRAGKMGEAWKEIQKALALGGRDPQLQFHATAIALATGHNVDAAAHLQSVLDTNPRFSPLHEREISEFEGRVRD